MSKEQQPMTEESSAPEQREYLDSVYNMIDKNRTDAHRKAAQREYLQQLNQFGDVPFDELTLDDQRWLAWYFLSSVNDPVGWITEAHTETDLFMLDIEQYIGEQYLDNVDLLQRRRNKLIGYLAGEIQKHLEDPATFTPGR